MRHIKIFITFSLTLFILMLVQTSSAGNISESNNNADLNGSNWDNMSSKEKYIYIRGYIESLDMSGKYNKAIHFLADGSNEKEILSFIDAYNSYLTGGHRNVKIEYNVTNILKSENVHAVDMFNKSMILKRNAIPIINKLDYLYAKFDCNVIPVASMVHVANSIITQLSQ